MVKSNFLICLLILLCSNSFVNANDTYKIPYENNRIIEIISKENDLELANKSNNYKEIIRISTELIKINPNNTKYYIDRANAYGITGNSQLELNDYNKAIDINPTDYLPYIYRGMYWFSIWKEKDAIRDFSMSIKLNKGQNMELLSSSYFFRGLTKKTFTHDTISANKDYEMSYKISPKTYSSLKSIGL